MAISQVQQKSASEREPTTAAAATFDATPIEGNLLIAVLHTQRKDTQDGLTDPSGWDIAVDSFSGNAALPRIRVLYKIAGASEPSLVEFANLPDNANATWTLHIFEYSGMHGVQAEVLDVTAAANSGTSSATSQSTGTTATTSEAVSLALGAVGTRINDISFLNSWTNSFVQQTVVTGEGGTTAHKILNTTGAQETLETWTPGTQAVGAIAVFKGATAAPQYDETGKIATILAVTTSQDVLTLANAPPTVALNSPADAAVNQSLTPTLNFIGTDPNGDDVRYQIDVNSGVADYPSLRTQGGSPSGTAINSWEDLHNIRDGLAGTYFLNVDLDGSSPGYDTYASSLANGGAGWDPIGDTGSPFTGTLDGNGHTVSGLFINRPAKSRAGLFGRATGPTIKKLGLVDVDITGDSHVGGVVGWCDGGTIDECYVTGTVTGGSTGTEAGGLAGAFEGDALEGHSNGFITNCYARCTVTGEDAVGGLVGFTGAAGLTIQIDKCYAVGVTSGTTDVGGLVGAVVGSSVLNSFWDTDVGPATSAGGTGKTTAQMKDVATFTDLATVGLDAAWDFLDDPNDDVGQNDTWQIFEVQLRKLSGTDVGFANIDTPANNDPFNSGEVIEFTVQAADELAPDTEYFWLVRAKDPTGSDTFGDWSATRSFTTGTGSQEFNETGKVVSILAITTGVDHAARDESSITTIVLAEISANVGVAYTETVLVTILAQTTAEDVLTQAESGQVTVLAQATATDTGAFAEQATTTVLTQVVASDTAATAEAASVTVLAALTASDTAHLAESLLVTTLAQATTTDTQHHDETGRQITALVQVETSNTSAMAETASITVLAQVTASDAGSLIEVASITALAVTTASDAVRLAEILTATPLVQVTASDTQAMTDAGLATPLAAVTTSDIGAFQESATLTILVLVTATDSTVPTELAVLVILAAVSATDAHSSSESATVHVLGQVSANDAVRATETPSVAILAQVTGSAALTITEGVSVTILAQVASADTLTTGANQYDETGRQVTALASVSGRDTGVFQEQGSQTVLAVASATDAQSTVETATVTPLAVVTATEALTRGETGHAVTVLAQVAEAETARGIERGIMLVPVVVTVQDTQAASVGLAVLVMVVVTGTDALQGAVVRGSVTVSHAPVHGLSVSHARRGSVEVQHE